MENKLLTPYEVAKYLRVDYRTVYQLLHSGKLKGSKVGRVWRIRMEDVDRYLRETANRQDNHNP